MANPIRILVVEDDPVDQIHIKRALNHSELLTKVKVVASAGEAKEVLKKHTFDCCFFDYMLEDTTGLELLREVRNLGIMVPIVIITAQTDPQLSTQAIKAGAANYITKTLITPDGLSLIIRNSVDITKTKNELLKAKEEALRHARVKQDFLANMSHEIRTPMNAVLGFSRLLLQTSLDDIQRDYTQSIYYSAENLLVLINDILDFSKIESGKLSIEKTSFNTLTIASNAIGILQNTAQQKKLNLSLYVDKEVPHSIMGDPYRLNQILINLLGNAIKFTKKGSVELYVRLKDPKTILFQVKDSGIGIPKDKIDAIFESFTQAQADTTRQYGGTGLGLTIVKNLVNLMGGKVGVESELGKGTTFYFDMPFEIPLAAAIKGSRDRVKLSQKIQDNTLILLAEDNLMNQKITTTYLRQFGCNYDLAETGVEALKKAQTQDYDIILMDIQMPEMDGVEATMEIRKKDKKVPIVAMTAHALASEKDRCFRIGMNDYLTKPFRAEELREIIIKNALQRNRSPLKESKNATSSPKRPTIHAQLDCSHLESESDGDMEFVKELLEIFYRSIGDFGKNMPTYLSQNRVEDVYNLAHKIRPNFETFGLASLGKRVGKLEIMAKENKSIESLRKEYEDIARVLPDVHQQIEKKLKMSIEK